MRKKGYQYFFVILVLFVGIHVIQIQIDYRKKLENLESALVLMPGQMAGSLVLGGFKGLAADLLWLQMESYWHSGQHYKILPLLEAIAWLQPSYILVWTIGGWHMAYNIYAEVKTEEEKRYWYDQGIKFLKKGLTYPFNANKYDIYFELGWTYYHKGKDYPNAVKYLEKATKYPHPDYVDDVLAHAYEKNGEIEKAIKQWEFVRDNYTAFFDIATRMINDLKTKGKATP